MQYEYCQVAAEGLPIRFDTSNIYCLGYSLGGSVALHAAAMDERINGVISWCGFTPMRSDHDSRPTGGNRRWYEWHRLYPQLGFFQGREQEIPYDYEDLLAIIAPRPCMIHAPVYDRQADVQDVSNCVDKVRAIWAAQDAADRLVYSSPLDYNRLHEDQHPQIVDWLKKITI